MSNWKSHWQIDPETTYLNHGSFGPSPTVVREAQHRWIDEVERQPMQFFLRRMEDALLEAADTLGNFVGADGRDLLFVDNATFGMNIVARSVDLQPGDEVLLTDHEYGAVMRIWRERCKEAGAEFRVQSLPWPLHDADALVDQLFSGVTDKTKLLVVSHVTSQTALVFPIDEICRRARERGIQVCVDGPHAIAAEQVNLRRTDPDFYVASLHKWLCAPFGSGFLYVRRRHQQSLQQPIVSWGRSLDGRPFRWQDEYNWAGTRNPSAFLAVPATIEFLDGIGFDTFRKRAHELVCFAAEKIQAVTGLAPLFPLDRAWSGPMVSLPLGELEEPQELFSDPWQARLWEEHGIEVPIFHWHGRRLMRVSCHLYNDEQDLERLAEALRELIEQENA